LSSDEQDGPLSQSLESVRAHYKQADPRDKAQVVEALKGGVAVVFHMAAPVPSINSFKLHFDVTVTGTRNMID
jgi:nucleoside-diphosphate-sugar epimerase